MRPVILLVGFLTLTVLLEPLAEPPVIRVGAPAAEAPTRSGPIGSGTSSGLVPDRWPSLVSGLDAGHTDRGRLTALASEALPRCSLSRLNDTTSEMSEPCSHSKLSATRLEMVAWARGRFQAAGLVPPRARFVFYDDTRKCRLRRGLFHPGTRTIEICNLNRETLVHELAHAWVETNLTEEAKADFMRHRGLATWNDHSVPWADRATEHAAEIVAWGVEEESRLISWMTPEGQHTLRLLTIPDSTPDVLAMSFQLLTGIPAHPDRIRSQPTLKPAFSPEARRVGSPTG